MVRSYSIVAWTIVRHLDKITLIVAATCTAILDFMGLIPQQYTSSLILSILVLLSVVVVRYTQQTARIVQSIRAFGDELGLRQAYAKVGIQEFVPRRGDLNVQDMHEEAARSKNVFVLSRYFRSFASKSLQDALRKCIENGGSVRILVYSSSGAHLSVELESDVDEEEAKGRIKATLKHLEDFGDSLPKDQGQKFEVRRIEGQVIYVTLVGMDQTLYVTFCLNGVTGEESPTIICKNIGNGKDLPYVIFKDEFERLWRTAKPGPGDGEQIDSN